MATKIMSFDLRRLLKINSEIKVRIQKGKKNPNSEIKVKILRIGQISPPSASNGPPLVSAVSSAK